MSRRSIYLVCIGLLFGNWLKERQGRICAGRVSAPRPVQLWCPCLQPPGFDPIGRAPAYMWSSASLRADYDEAIRPAPALNEQPVAPGADVIARQGRVEDAVRRVIHRKQSDGVLLCSNCAPRSCRRVLYECPSLWPHASHLRCACAQRRRKCLAGSRQRRSYASVTTISRPGLRHDLSGWRA